MFPSAGAQIYRNEAGEVTGWDYPDMYDGGVDLDDMDGFEYDSDDEWDDADDE